MGMKQISFFLALAFVLSACPSYDSLPEPELPLEVVEFTNNAQYTALKRSIFLEYQTRVPYDGIYPFYNKNEQFTMASYLKNRDIDIVKTEVKGEGITIFLAAEPSLPLQLDFDTTTPWYFYDYRSWNYIIQAKAYIKTESLLVN